MVIETWLMLAYRIPREPSTPRIAVWRKLRTLGAGQLVDGLAALPDTPRASEHFLWLAQEIRENGGTASLWRARPDSDFDSAEVTAAMNAAVESDYAALIERVRTDPGGGRALASFRAELRKIESRDYFAAPSAKLAREAVEGASARAGSAR